MVMNANLSVVLTFVDALAQAGVTDVCISPGSRSTPLTIACARHPQLSVWTLRDERSGGYFALGMARASARPVVLICTSGTAAANYLPAVVEAFFSRIPLIVITADRPPELRGVGSNQTIDQVGLYASHVKWFIEMPVPEDSPLLHRHAVATAQRAVAIGRQGPAGPVHINWPFREPLIPPLNDEGHKGTQLLSGNVSIHPTEAVVSLDVVTLLMTKLHTTRGLIVCGPQDSRRDAQSLVALAQALQFPICADPLSQLRTINTHDAVVIASYDVFLRPLMASVESHSRIAELAPEVVICVGQPPTSKVLNQFLQMVPHAVHLVVDEDVAWRDPLFLATDVITMPLSAFCNSLQSACPERESTVFQEVWADADRLTTNGLAVAEQMQDHNFEGRVFWELAQILPDHSTLFVGNSMPIRDMDAFFPVIQRSIQVYGNRGASGIDGIVSSAAGVSAKTMGPTLLVLGDLSFYHDLNGLLMVQEFALDLVIVLINNDGGGIFSFLPPAGQQDTFSYFSTPHGLSFSSIVETYGGQFHTVIEWNDLRATVLSALTVGGLHVVEVRTERVRNQSLHMELFRDVTNQWSAV